MYLRLSPHVPQLLTLPGDLPSSTVSGDTEHPEGRDSASAPPVRCGLCQAAGACVGSARTPVSALSVWGPGGGDRVSLCWF